MTTNQILIGVGLILALAVGSQVLASRLRIPAIIVLLPAGFIAGALTTDVDPQRLLGPAFEPLVSLSVAVILYDAGLSLDMGKLKGHTRKVVIRLIVLGVLITWALAASVAAPLLGMSRGAAVMLGFSTLSGSNSPHHVYELRLYHVNEGKMDALKARFGNHTDSIFKRHNMKSIGYWSPEDAPSSDLFIYILEHPSRQEGEKNWAAFQADPEWQKVKAESEVHGPLVDHIDRYFMDPTSFSALN